MLTIRSISGRALRMGSAALLVWFAVPDRAEAADYTARARISQFNSFTEDISSSEAFVLLEGDHGDPAFPYSVSGLATQIKAEVDANANKDNIQLKTAHGQVDNFGVTFSSEVNSLAVGGSIALKIPFTITYDVDVPDVPHAFSQGSAVVQYSNNARQQPADNLIGNGAGQLSLLNSSSMHLFVNQTGAFAAITPVENIEDTLTGELLVSLSESPGNPIEIELLVLAVADAGGSGAGGFANSRMIYEWNLSAAEILDDSDTPVADSGVTVTLEPPAVPSVGAAGLLTLTVGMGWFGARAARRQDPSVVLT